MVWKPHLTVAAVIEHNHRFLLVEEETSNGPQFNQPAGHLEENEDLLSAIKREVYEETAWHFEPDHLIAIQLWRKNPLSPTFVRFTFSGYCHSYNPTQPLDECIIDTHWLNRDQIEAKYHDQQLRSPLVLLSIDEYLSGQRYPLSLIKSFLDV
jgi:8-oxo-dGTP pyrophosphatase MutT (NUDIX family)